MSIYGVTVEIMLVIDKIVTKLLPLADGFEYPNILFAPRHLHIEVFYKFDFNIGVIFYALIVRYEHAHLNIFYRCKFCRKRLGNITQTAQLFSKEIENDPDNVEAILDAAYTAAAFTDLNLLGLLLQ